MKRKEVVAIVGSRDLSKRGLEAVVYFVGRLSRAHTVISGDARGVDRTAQDAAEARGLRVIRYPADWNRHKSRAGFLRNTELVRRADKVAAFWDGKSNGTWDTILKAKEMRKLWVVYVFKGG